MNTHANKTPGNRSQSIAHAPTNKKGGNWSTFHFLDNRPAAVAQRNFQGMANNIRQVNQLTTIHEVRLAGERKLLLNPNGEGKVISREPARTSVGGEGVTQRTNRVRPSKADFVKGAAAYKANRSVSRGKEYPKTYEEYLTSFDSWEEKYDQKIGDPTNIKPVQGDDLYHMTQEENLTSIRAAGLAPKKLEWGGPDASKDGVVSFSTTEAGAGAMGRKSVLLRVTLTGAHVAAGIDWWSAGGTETRTTQTFARGDIMLYDKPTSSWVAL